MAQESDKSLANLQQEIAHSRQILARDLSGLAYELNFPLKLRQSFQRRSKLWIAAALILGVLLTVRSGSRTTKLLLPGARLGSRSGGPAQGKGMLLAGLAMGTVRLVGTFLRPVVISYVTKKLRGYATGAARDRKW